MIVHHLFGGFLAECDSAFSDQYWYQGNTVSMCFTRPSPRLLPIAMPRPKTSKTTHRMGQEMIFSCPSIPASARCMAHHLVAQCTLHFKPQHDT